MKINKILPNGTKVYHYDLGWFEICHYDKTIDRYTAKCDIYAIEFNNEGKIDLEHFRKPVISLTNYDFINGGFTPIEDYWKPKPGDFGFFWDTSENGGDMDNCITGRIKEIDNNKFIFNDYKYDNYSRELPEHIKKQILT